MLGGLASLVGVGGYALYQHVTGDSTDSTASVAVSPSVASQNGNTSTLPTLADYQSAYSAASGNDASAMVNNVAPPATSYVPASTNDVPTSPQVIIGTPTITTQTGVLTGQNVVTGGALGAPTTPAAPIPTPTVQASTTTTTTTTTKKAPVNSWAAAQAALKASVAAAKAAKTSTAVKKT
jgi:hypothetical protein